MLFFVSCVSHAFASVHCCLEVTTEKGLTSWLLLGMFILFFYFPMWYPGSGVVLDCVSFPDLCRLSYFAPRY